MATKKKAKKSTKAKSAKKLAKGAKTAPVSSARQTAKKGAKKAKRSPAKKAGAVQRRAATAGRAPAKPPKEAKKALPKKAGVRKAAPARAVARAKPLVRREDRPGHLDPHYVADLRARSDSSPPDPTSFVERPRSRDDLVEELGEEYVASATAGEYEAEDAQNQDVPEEVGGPFVETTDGQEFAPGIDASNPKGATREPFPRT